LYILDTKTYEWKKPQTSGQQPRPRRAHTATLVGTKIFIFGGGDGAFALNETYVFDTEKLHWTQVNTSGFTPSPSGYHSSSLVGDKIVCFGGSDTQCCYSEMTVLDTVSNTWSKKKNYHLQNVDFHTLQIVLVHGYLYLVEMMVLQH